MQKETIIELENVSKQFKLPLQKKTSLAEHIIGILTGKKEYRILHALEEINLTVQKGECFGIVGLNGSGKSTLLRIMAQIIQPTKGRIAIKQKPAALLELGLGFQEELTARENVFLNGAILGMQHKQLEKAFNNIMEFAELKTFENAKLKHFSSGMQLRLAFSTAIYSNRELFLIDEVLAVGDARFQEKCLDKMKEFKQQEKTIVLASHNLELVESFCDKAIWLEQGKIKKAGTAKSVIEQYKKSNN